MRTLFAAFVGIAAALAVSCDDETSEPAGGSGGDALLCNPGETRACYDGPEETANVGACKGGVQSCQQHGRGWGDCVGQILPAQESCDEPADENCDGLSSCGQTIWVNRLGVQRDEVVLRLDTDDAGSFYLGGLYRSGLDLGSGELPTIDNSIDALIAKYDADGEHVWSVGLPAEGSVILRDIAVSSSGDTVVAVIDAINTLFVDGTELPPRGDNDVVVVKLDGDGDIQWAKRFGDDDEQVANGVALDDAGNVIVTGYFRSELDFNTRAPLTSAGFNLDAFVAKLDPNGNEIWSRAYNGPLDQLPRDVKVAPDGRVLVTGSILGRVDFGGGELTAKGETQDVFLLGLSADGEHLFSRAWGGDGNDEAWAVAIDSLGHAIITGRFEREVRFGSSLYEAVGAGAIFVVKVDEGGNDVWAQRIGGSSEQSAMDIVVDSADRIIISGYYEGDVTFGEAGLPPSGLREPNILIAKLEPTGAPVWARGIAVDGNQDVGGVRRGWRSVAVLPSDFIALGGFVQRSIDFGGGPLEELGGADLLIAKLAP